MIHTCLQCKGQFSAPQSVRKYCNHSCYAKARSGKKPPCSFAGRKHKQKTKRRMQEAQKGSNHWNWRGGNNCDDCGKKLHNQSTRRCRACNIKEMHGENNPNWKGGRSTDWRNYRHHFIMRRYRERGGLGQHTQQEWEELYKSVGKICLCCKQPDSKIKITRDHIIPLSRGGSNSIENIQPLCMSCNLRKFTKTTNYLNEKTR